MAISSPSIKCQAPDLATVSEAEWAEAKRRAEVLGPLAEGPTCPEPWAEDAAKILGLSARQVYTLLKRYRGSGGLLTSLLPDKPSGGKGISRLRAEVDRVISDVIESVYLTRQRVPVSRVIEEVRRRCHQAGLIAPSDMTIRRRVHHVPTRLSLQKRHGRKALQAKTAPVQGAFPPPSHPLAVVQMDHTPVDIIIVDDTHRLPIGRPYVTFAIDVFSRCIAGLCLSLEPPSSVSVGLALTHAVLDKQAWLGARGIEGEWPINGKPECLHVDNAAEFHSEALHRGCDQHGIDLQYRPLGQPHYGGIVERVIGTFMQLVHGLPGTTFSNVSERGDYESERLAVFTLAELEHWLVIAIIDYYHRKLHHGLSLPPLEMYQEGIRRHQVVMGHRAPEPVPDARRFMLDFLPIVRRTLQRHGFMIDHIAYYSDALRPLIGDKRYGKFLIRRDPRDLSRVYVLDPISQQYLEVPYRTLSRPSMTLWEHRQAVKRLRERGRAAVDERAIFRALEDMRTVTENATTQTRRTRRQATRRAYSKRDTAKPPSAKSQATSRSRRKASVPRFRDIELW